MHSTPHTSDRGSDQFPHGVTTSSRGTLGFAAMVLGIIIFAMAGCASNDSDIDGPRTRLGSLPFPGPFTLYKLADPDHLGVARYAAGPRLFSKEEDECGHGILYTERAGFLDLSHVRETMDWSWYVSEKVAKSLRRRDASVRFEGTNGCETELKFHYPAQWDTFSPTEREQITVELSRRIGELVSINLMTWHEIITSYGYGSTIVVSERGSAFTYDDTASHMVGIEAARRAIRNRTGSWDQDATLGLREELNQLGVVSVSRAADAAERVKGKWWRDGVCIRRMLDVGLEDGSVLPWLVPGFPVSDAGQNPKRFLLPVMHDVAGRDFTGFWSMTIEPTLLIPSEVRDLCPGRPKLIDPAVHFPVLIEAIRRDMKKEFGALADRPDEDVPMLGREARR